jgi:hypothetical protein
LPLGNGWGKSQCSRLQPNLWAKARLIQFVYRCLKATAIHGNGNSRQRQFKATAIQGNGNSRQRQFKATAIHGNGNKAAA